MSYRLKERCETVAKRACRILCTRGVSGWRGDILSIRSYPASGPHDLEILYGDPAGKGDPWFAIAADVYKSDPQMIVVDSWDGGEESLVALEALLDRICILESLAEIA